MPQIARAVSVPVVASGGFASGASLVAALALGASGIHCGTAFIATDQSFAHDVHKQMLIASNSEAAIHTDAFAINWPPDSPVRVLANSVTDLLEGKYYGHHPDDIERIEIGREGERPIYRLSTDSPLRNMTGDFEAMALFAGQVAGSITEQKSAGDVVEAIMCEAEETIGRISGTSK